MEELELIVAKLKDQGKMNFPESATKEQIETYEKKHEVVFPSKYKEWLLFSDGGEFFLPAGVQFYGVAHKPLIDVDDDDRPSENYIVMPKPARPQAPTHESLGHRLWDRTKKAAKAVSRFCVVHKEEIVDIALSALENLGPVVVEKIGSSIASKHSISNDSDYSNSSSCFSTISDNSSSTSMEKESYAPSTRNYPSEHNSPVEHTVKAHGQHYGKDKIWKEKAPYTRGGKKMDE